MKETIRVRAAMQPGGWTLLELLMALAVLAVLIGMAVHFLSEEPKCAPGIAFCSRTVLRLGVGLLGLRITVGQVVDLG